MNFHHQCFSFVAKKVVKNSSCIEMKVRNGEQNTKHARHTSEKVCGGVIFGGRRKKIGFIGNDIKVYVWDG
jgi:hypothetical protein